MNLLHNAVEYNRPDGRSNLAVERDGSRIAFEVRDTGIGMPAEVREKIFERFYRADASRHATGVHAGLGLAIVKEYIEQLGGTLSVESTSDIGSTFRRPARPHRHFTVTIGRLFPACRTRPSRTPPSRRTGSRRFLNGLRSRFPGYKSIRMLLESREAACHAFRSSSSAIGFAFLLGCGGPEKELPKDVQYLHGSRKDAEIAEKVPTASEPAAVKFVEKVLATAS